MKYLIFFLISCTLSVYDCEAASTKFLLECIDSNIDCAGKQNVRSFAKMRNYGGLTDKQDRDLVVAIFISMDTPKIRDLFQALHALVQELDSVILALKGSKNELRRDTGERLSMHLDSPLGSPVGASRRLRAFGSGESSPGTSAASTPAFPPALPVAGSPGEAASVAAERTKSPTRRGFFGGGSADDSAKEMEALKAKVKELEKQRDAAVAALAASQSTSVPVMEALRREADAQAKSFAAEKTALDAAIATLSAKIISQDQGVAALRETNKFLEGKQEVIDKLTTQVAALTIFRPLAKKLFEAKIVKLKAELRDQAAKLVEANEKHKRQVDQLNARIADQDRELTAAKARETRVGELTAQIDKLQGEIATLKAQQASQQALRAAEVRRAVPVADTGCFGGRKASSRVPVPAAV